MDSFEEWLSALRREKIPIIVEGKNDKKALEYFDIPNVITLEKHALFEIIEKITDSSDAVIILTDLDKEGKKYYSKLSTEFGKRGVRIMNKYREFLFEKTSLTQIEGLVSYVSKNKKVQG